MSSFSVATALENAEEPDYAEQLFATFLEIEKKRKAIDYQRGRMAPRRYLVYMLYQIKQCYHLESATLHLAIYLLDYTLDSGLVHSDDAELLAVTAALVAIKSLERNVVSFSELNLFFLGGRYLVRAYQIMEWQLLLCTKFDLEHVTVANFVDNLSKLALSWQDYEEYSKGQSEMVVQHQARYNRTEYWRIIWISLVRQQGSYEQVCRHMAVYLHRLALHTVTMPQLYNVAGSLVAAACLAIARENYGFDDIWPERVQQHTKYTLEQITPTIDLIAEGMKCMFVKFVNNEFAWPSPAQALRVQAYADEVYRSTVTPDASDFTIRGAGPSYEIAYHFVFHDITSEVPTASIYMPASFREVSVTMIYTVLATLSRIAAKCAKKRKRSSRARMHGAASNQADHSSNETQTNSCKKRKTNEDDKVDEQAASDFDQDSKPLELINSLASLSDSSDDAAAQPKTPGRPTKNTDGDAFALH